MNLRWANTRVDSLYKVQAPGQDMAVIPAGYSEGHPSGSSSPVLHKMTRRYSPKREKQFMANLQKINERRKSHNKENNPAPTTRSTTHCDSESAAPDPTTHPTIPCPSQQPHRNTLRARADTEHKFKAEKQRYEAAKRDLRNTRRRERALRRKNTDLQDENQMLVDELESKTAVSSLTHLHIVISH